MVCGQGRRWSVGGAGDGPAHGGTATTSYSCMHNSVTWFHSCDQVTPLQIGVAQPLRRLAQVRHTS
eukprot:325982-Chlamydomonas_euryale.AAC.1